MASLWTIELFGTLRARSAERVITRFRTRQTGALLAYLAFYSQRAHPRAALAETVWPADAPAVARRKLRVALYSLRGQLEPPGIAAGMVIAGTRPAVQLRPEACHTEVAVFEAALRAAGTARAGAERIEYLQHAADQYSGELLPDLFDDWVLTERRRLETANLQALGELIALLEQAGDLPGAIYWARRAVDADPLQQEAHHTLIRLLAAAGQPDAAHRQYRNLAHHLDAELGLEPDAASQQLAESIAAARRGGARDADLSPRPDPAAPTPPPQRSTPPPARAGRLPLQLTRFIGLAPDLAWLQARLGSPPAALETQRTQSPTEDPSDPTDPSDRSASPSDPLGDLCVSSAVGGEFCRLITLMVPAAWAKPASRSNGRRRFAMRGPAPSGSSHWPTSPTPRTFPSACATASTCPARPAPSRSIRSSLLSASNPPFSSWTTSSTCSLRLARSSSPSSSSSTTWPSSPPPAAASMSRASASTRSGRCPFQVFRCSSVQVFRCWEGTKPGLS